MEIKNSKELKKILLEYDVFFFDVYGVVFNGKYKFEGTNETLRFLKENNKTVLFLSNSLECNEYVKKKFTNIEILEKEHYDEFITSGMVFTNFLSEQKDKITINFDTFKNYYIFGKIKTSHNLLNFNLVEDLSKADFVFVGYPVFSQEEYNNFSIEEKKHLSKSFTINDYYESDDINLYIKKINEIIKYKLPVVSNCADLIAQAPITKDSDKIQYIIRQGSIIEMYKNLGGEVLNIAKPSSLMYDYALNLLKNNFLYDDEKIKKSKFLMIGDTINTDILGAKNAKNDLNIEIDSMLTLCGVSARDFGQNLDKIKQYCNENNIDLKYVISDVGVMLK